MARALALTAAACTLAAVASAHETTLLAAAEEYAGARAALERAAPEAQLAPLRVTLVDATTGATLAGNLRITAAGGAALAMDLAEPRANEPRSAGWHASNGPFVLRVPPGKLHIEAFQGLETSVAVKDVDVLPGTGADVVLPLARFVSAAERGLASGNTHLHLMGWERARVEAYLRDVTAADQLDFAWVSHLERFDTETPYTSNELTRADLEALGTPSTQFGWGEELRHNFAPYVIGYGHVLLLDLQRLVQPVSIGPVLAGTPHDAPGLAAGIAEAKAQQATAIWAHGANGYEDLPSWLLGRVDAQNLYDGAAVGETLRGDHAAFASVYYPLLDVGLAVPFSTGTDWFIGDLSRVYVALEGDRTTATFLAALRAGRSFITNGPLLELTAGAAGPGGILALDAPGVIPVRVRAVGRTDFRALELLVDGRVVARSESIPAGNHFEAGIVQGVAIEGPAWIAARIAPADAVNEFGNALFAHTSAVTVEIAGERPFRSAVARELVLEMDWNARTIRAKSAFADGAQADAVTAPYREAMRALSSRLTWHDWLHAWAVRTMRTLRGWLGL